MINIIDVDPKQFVTNSIKTFNRRGYLKIFHPKSCFHDDMDESNLWRKEIVWRLFSNNNGWLRSSDNILVWMSRSSNRGTVSSCMSRLCNCSITRQRFPGYPRKELVIFRVTSLCYKHVVGKLGYVCSYLPYIKQDWIHVAKFDEWSVLKFQEECVSFCVCLPLRPPWWFDISFSPRPLWWFHLSLPLPPSPLWWLNDDHDEGDMVWSSPLLRLRLLYDSYDLSSST